MSATDIVPSDQPHHDATRADERHHGLDAEGHGHGLTDKGYVMVAVILAVMTAAEVTLSYVDVGSFFLPLLLILMAAKFFTVVSYFMHLRFDNRIFTWMFYAGLALAIFVYCLALLTFEFFSPP